MFTATDNLIDDIGLDTPNTEDIFRSLFPTDDPFTYRRRNVHEEFWSTIKPYRWTVKAYEIAAQYSAKHELGYKFRANYKGAYLFSVFTPKNPPMVRNLILDIDNAQVAKDLMATPLKDHGIWCPSNTPGRYHVHIPIHETSYKAAASLVSDWVQYHGLMGKIETNVTGLRSTTLPGQSQINFPVDPRTDERLCKTFAETKKFYADWYRYKRVHLEDILIREGKEECQNQTCKHTSLSSLSIGNNSTPSMQANQSSTLSYQKTNSLTSNSSNGLIQRQNPYGCNSRSSISADIPGLNHSIGCTVGGQRHDFYSVDDCIDEGDGFLFSNAYYPAVLRKFRGDTYLAAEEVMKNRQSMRTPNSKKENSSLRATHVNSMIKWYGARYDETKLKHDPQQELDDKTALIDFFIRDKRSLVHHGQKELKLHRSAIRSKYGRSLYRDAILTIPFVISSMSRSNGRIATKSSKVRAEYTFCDSVCWLDFPTINGSRRKRDKIIRILKDCGIFTDQHEGKDTHDHAKHICSRWTVCTAILDRSKLRDKKNEGNQKSPTESFSSAKIGTHSPEPKYDYSQSSDPYAQVWHTSEVSESFTEKVHRMRENLAPE